jgi:Cu2+-exporting ATPase
VVFARDGVCISSFVFADRVRPGAAEELRSLRSSGFEVYILSGDHPDKVRVLAAELGLVPGCALGGLSPGEKADWFRSEGKADTLMLGDGANDSLAFDQALCRGTPVIHRGILEQKADFFYLGKGLGGIRCLFEVDRVRRHTQLVILVFSVVYNLLAVSLAVTGHMNPLIAAVVMPLNSLLGLAIVTIGMRRAFAPSAP